MEGLSEAFAVLPQRYGGHLWLSLTALLTGLAISAPLGILAARNAQISGPALGVTSVVQTIPGLALLALMVPLLGGQIGYWPAFVALALYSMLPILRNTIVGLEGVPDDTREAALGVGMTPAQRLVQVDLPLAAPVMVAGLRTAAVWVVGAATLSTPVGYESLGNYIFSGLQIRDWSLVLFGCIASAGLAIALDQAIRLFEIAARLRSWAMAVLGCGALAVLAVPVVDFSGSSRASAPLVLAQTDGAPVTLEGQSITIGAKPFTEQYILAAFLKRILEEEGAIVTVRENLGSTIGFDALVNNEIDVFIDYTGTIWATVLKEDAPVPRHRMFVEASAALWGEYGVLSIGRLGFENAYAFAMARDQAEAMGIASIMDLVPSAGDLTKGGDVEFFARPEWLRVRDAYGLTALSTRGMDSTFMYDAIRNGEVDVITAYTTDGRIDAFDLVLLDDPLGALPPYDAFVLVSPENGENAPLHRALGQVINRIDAATMRGANGRVDLDRNSPGAAADWLYAQVFADRLKSSGVGNEGSGE